MPRKIAESSDDDGDSSPPPDDESDDDAPLRRTVRRSIVDADAEPMAEAEGNADAEPRADGALGEYFQMFASLLYSVIQNTHVTL